jgi:hypothetical protein
MVVQKNMEEKRATERCEILLVGSSGKISYLGSSTKEWITKAEDLLFM